MKKIRSVLAFTLALTMLVGFCVPSFAQETPDFNVSAPYVYLAEANSGRILYSKNSEKKIAPASLTKIMTAILVAEKLNKDSEITVNASAVASFKDGYVTAGLKAGEKLTVDQLLHLMLIPSANDAATVLAEAVSSTVGKFVHLMNEKAQQLGCSGTHFLSPYGDDNKNHYTTASDMYLMAKAFASNKYLMTIANQTGYDLPATNKSNAEKHFETTNKLLIKNGSFYYSLASGIKTGHTTAAGDCLISSSVKGDARFIAVVMGADDSNGVKFTECAELLRWARANYTYRTLASDGSAAAVLRLNAKSDHGSTQALYNKSLSVLVSGSDNVTQKINLYAEKRTVKAGEKIGNAVFTVNDRTYTVDLIAAQSAAVDDTMQTIMIVVVAFLAVSVAAFAVMYYNERREHELLKRKINRFKKQLEKRNENK